MLPDFLRVGPPTAGIFLIETMLFTGMMFLLGRNNRVFGITRPDLSVCNHGDDDPDRVVSSYCPACACLSCW